MQREAVKHVPHSEYAYALDEETMVFRLRAAKGDLKACILHYVDKFMAEPYQFQTTPMALVATDTILTILKWKSSRRSCVSVIIPA